MKPGGELVITQSKLVVAGIAVAALAVGTASVAVSSPEGTAAIKARQEAMEAVKDGMGALAAIAKGEAPFDAAVVEKNAGLIAENLKEASGHFPEGSAEGDVETRALPGIWSDGSDFQEKMDAAHAQAEALQSVTDEAAFRPALGQLGNSCKDCHQTYRRSGN
jgi:cytochrome c556